MKNFKSEIGCVIVFKMLIYRKIRGTLEMTNENVRFFSSFFRGFREGSYQKEGFSYRLGYLIDKKEYRKGKFIGRKDCRFKK